MDKKMLIFDLDDTLLTSEKTITEDAVEAIKVCKSKGMIIGYITGRARAEKNTIFFTNKYNLPCDFIAYYNGAEIYAGNISIESNVISHKNAMKIIHRLVEIYPDAKISVKHEPWSFFKKGQSPDSENWNIETGEKVKCDIFNLPHYNVQRIRIDMGTSFFCNKDDEKNKLSKCMTKDSIFFVNSDGSAMILYKNATKERALNKASEYFNISLTDIIAFGDDVNDIEMLKTAGIGVAMGNAINSVKEIADYITQTNDNNGISGWINKYLLK